MPTVSGVPRDDPRLNDARLLSDARSQILFGLNGLARTPANSATITAIIYGLHNQISPADLQRTRQLAHRLAFALARERYPNDSRKSTQEAGRLRALLTESNQGAALLVGGPPEKRAAALEATFSDPSITPQLLNKYGDALSVPAVATAMARELVSVARQSQISVPYPDYAVERLAKILRETEQGRELLFGPASSEARAQALCVISYPSREYSCNSSATKRSVADPGNCDGNRAIVGEAISRQFPQHAADLAGACRFKPGRRASAQKPNVRPSRDDKGYRRPQANCDRRNAAALRHRE